MIICRDKRSLRNHINSLLQTHPDMTVGFVPTMGFLHEGHASLIRAARTQTQCVVVSIFVNPTQFGPEEDFDKYPRDEEHDLAICRQEQADIVFIPTVGEMYSGDSATSVSVSDLTESLCGRYRPGHFTGVTTIVAKLFNLINPHRAFFGQKDAQQALVIRKMVSDLDYHVEIHICPTVREADGLAMSSRNVRLSAETRIIAPHVYQSLLAAARCVEKGETSVSAIISAAQTVLDSAPEITVQYMECLSRDSLKSMHCLDRPALLATAVFLGGVRLIDNIFLDPPEIQP